MKMLFVNVTKKLYFTLEAFTGGYTHETVPQKILFAGPQLALGSLLGQFGKVPEPHVGTAGPGAWLGDKIAVIRADDEGTHDPLEADLRALGAPGPGGPDTPYTYVLKNFRDVSDEVSTQGGLIPDLHDMLHSIIHEWLTRPRDYSWVTPDVADELLEKVRVGGDEEVASYCRWLLGCAGLQAKAKAHVQGILSSVVGCAA